jgi:hypothetical protein
MIAFLATILMVVRGRVVAGSVVAAAVVAAIVGSNIDGETAPEPEQVATFSFPSSDALPADAFHLRRGLLGGTLARSSIRVDQGGECFAASASHGSSRANPVTFDSDFAGCTHAFASISSGDQTCSAVATAFAAALESAGATGVVADGCDVTVTPATAAATGRARSTVRADQGLWGMQRDLAFASGATTNGTMGATGGVHLPSPCDGRVTALCIRADGGENVRLGIGDGPAYATDPAAVTIDGQCVALAVDNNARGCCVMTDPVLVDSGDDVWMFFRGSSSEMLRFREHGGTPVGRGDLVLDESLIWSELTGDSTVAFGATVDVGGGGGPFALYADVSFQYECANDGTYAGDGALDEWVGYQSTSIASADLTDPSDMADETVTFRYPVLPWTSVELAAIRQGVGTRTAGDDFGIALYLWDAGDVAEFPSLSSAALLQSIGPFGVSAAAGFNTHTLAVPQSVDEALTGGGLVATSWNCGRAGGAAATSLQFVYDENGTATDCDLVHWTDDGRAWSDFCDEQGHGVDTEYQSRESNGSTLPASDPTLEWPDPFAVDADGTTDAAPLNVPRQAIRIVRSGITAAVE